ncbi:MAG: hypothetical protein ACT4OM_13930 [Actinomycetota bacterium]
MRRSHRTSNRSTASVPSRTYGGLLDALDVIAPVLTRPDLDVGIA